MKVFLSWSGKTSRAVAEALGEWLPKVIQGVEPFLSAKDIDKGANWTVELARELTDAEFGIICLAPDNLLSPWLNYEAGAITKSVNSRVSPILFAVKKEEVTPPMSQLQLTSLDLDEMQLLMTSLNKAAGEPISGAVLNESVEMWWPSLQAKLDAIPIPIPTDSSSSTSAPEPAKPAVDPNEMLEEVLHRMRTVDRRLEQFESQAQPLRHGNSTPSKNARRESQNEAIGRALIDVFSQRGFEPSGMTWSTSHIGLKFTELLTTEQENEVVELARLATLDDGVPVEIRTPVRTFEIRPDGSIQDTVF